jgi:hypothetical protein
MPLNLEHLTGHAARQRFEQLRASHRGVFEKAAAMLLRHGFVDTGVVEIIRTPRAVRNSRGDSPRPYSLVDSVADTEGEIVYWSWDDGDQTTWEGNIYLHEYSTVNWISFNGQFSVETANAWAMYWDDPVGASEPAGGGPDNQGVRFQQPPMFPNAAVFAKTAISPRTRTRGPYSLVIDWIQVQNKIQDWAWCAAFGCAGSTATCQILPGTPREKGLCSAATCLGISVGCLYVLK